MLQRVKMSLAYLERILPTELPYRGHTLKRMSILLSDDTAIVTYLCDTFFDCARHSHIDGVMWFGRTNYKGMRQGLRRMYWQLEREVAFETTQGCSILPRS